MSKRIKILIKNHCKTYYPSLEAVCKRYWKTDPQQIVTPKIEVPYYVCPFCLKSLAFINDLDVDGDEFTQDHYPPESVGGLEKVLVCKNCNSRYGHEFDFGIKDTLQTFSFYNKYGKLPAKIKLDGFPGNYHSTLSWENSTLITSVDFAKYPLFDKEFKKRVATKSINQLTLSFRFSHESKLELAFLKAAYLKCFSLFGYDFALSHNARNIVKVLDGELNHPLSNFGVFRDDSPTEKAPAVLVVTSPLHYRSIVCSFNSSIEDLDKTFKHFVVIPLKHEHAWENLKAFEKIEFKKELELTHGQLNSSDGVRSNRYFDYTALSNSIFAV